jgi:hypothetical protein
MDLIRQRVAATDARITAKRLLPVAVAAGYKGSARNFRRAVSKAKRDWLWGFNSPIVPLHHC